MVNKKIVVYFEETYTHDGYCSGENCEYESGLHVLILDADKDEHDYKKYTGDIGEYCGGIRLPAGTAPMENHEERVTVVDTHTLHINALAPSI